MHPFARLRMITVLTAVPFMSDVRAAKAQADIPDSGHHAEVTLDQLNVEGTGGHTTGYRANRSRSATKTDTQLIDTPQAVTVVTREQVQDQGFQGVTEALRYVPGVFLHQGAGNRDEVVIRGQQSSADFYVNGMRDDAMYYRDLYNVERIEVLKGPNAMIFGRGGGGGVVNRVLKDATGTPVREVILQGGQYFNKRVAVDVGDRVSDSVFFRLNGMFEDSGTYRDHVDLRRWGINPTATILLGPETTLKLSYEYFHDDRTAGSRHPVPTRAALSVSRQHQNVLRQSRPQLLPRGCAYRDGGSRSPLRLSASRCGASSATPITPRPIRSCIRASAPAVR